MKVGCGAGVCGEGGPPPPAHGAVAEEISGTTGVKPQEFATSLRK